MPSLDLCPLLARPFAYLPYTVFLAVALLPLPQTSNITFTEKKTLSFKLKSILSSSAYQSPSQDEGIVVLQEKDFRGIKQPEIVAALFKNNPNGISLQWTTHLGTHNSIEISSDFKDLWSKNLSELTNAKNEQIHRNQMILFPLVTMHFLVPFVSAFAMLFASFKCTMMAFPMLTVIPPSAGIVIAGFLLTFAAVGLFLLTPVALQALATYGVPYLIWMLREKSIVIPMLIESITEQLQNEKSQQPGAEQKSAGGEASPSK